MNPLSESILGNRQGVLKTAEAAVRTDIILNLFKNEMDKMPWPEFEDRLIEICDKYGKRIHRFGDVKLDNKHAYACFRGRGIKSKGVGAIRFIYKSNVPEKFNQLELPRFYSKGINDTFKLNEFKRLPLWPMHENRGMLAVVMADWKTKRGAKYYGKYKDTDSLTVFDEDKTPIWEIPLDMVIALEEIA